VFPARSEYTGEGWLGDIQATDHDSSPVAGDRYTARPDQYPLAVAAGVGALMEKPLDLPLLLQAIEDLLLEPLMNHLSRITGKRADHAIFTRRPGLGPQNP